MKNIWVHILQTYRHSESRFFIGVKNLRNWTTEVMFSWHSHYYKQIATNFLLENFRKDVALYEEVVRKNVVPAQGLEKYSLPDSFRHPHFYETSSHKK